MALSFIQYRGDGATRLFPVPFYYLDRAHVSVAVDGIAEDFVWQGESAVLSGAPADGAVVTIERTTPGPTRSEDARELPGLHLILLAQEAADKAARTA